MCSLYINYLFIEFTENVPYHDISPLVMKLPISGSELHDISLRSSVFPLNLFSDDAVVRAVCP